MGHTHLYTVFRSRTVLWCLRLFFSKDTIVNIVNYESKLIMLLCRCRGVHIACGRRFSCGTSWSASGRLHHASERYAILGYLTRRRAQGKIISPATYCVLYDFGIAAFIRFTLNSQVLVESFLKKNRFLIYLNFVSVSSEKNMCVGLAETWLNFTCSWRILESQKCLPWAFCG